MNRIRPCLIFLILIVGFLTLISATNPVAAGPTWSTKYWNNRTLSGDPILKRHEPNVFHDWGDGAPADNIDPDNFSARWEANIWIDNAGTYQFTASMDDGMRVWVDGNLIIDSWYDSQVHTISVDLYLSSGNHPTRVEYYEAGGGAIAQLGWQPVQAISGWKGEYFDNPNLVGQAREVRDDAAINFEWGLNSPIPGVIPDNAFSVRWTRSLNLEPGRYRFTTTTDDGVRLWVNNVQVLDQWHNQTTTPYSVDVNLNGGLVPIRMEYFDNKDNATAVLTWTRIANETGPGLPNPETVVGSYGWSGAYYNNMSLEGTAVLQRMDLGPNYIWGSSSPAPNVVNADNFSVRWLRNLDLAAGEWIFTARVQGGVRVYVNDQLVINGWDMQNIYEVQNYSGSVAVPGGPVPVRIEFFKHIGLAEVKVDWRRPGTTAEENGVTEGEGVTAVMDGARYLAVRSGPGLEFAVETYLSQGQTVQALGRSSSGSWIKVQLPDGATGWAGIRYLTLNTPLAELPILAN